MLIISSNFGVGVWGWEGEAFMAGGGGGEGRRKHTHKKKKNKKNKKKNTWINFVIPMSLSNFGILYLGAYKIYRIHRELIKRSVIMSFHGPSPQQYHNEYTPIQIYWKFYHQKMKIFR